MLFRSRQQVCEKVFQSALFERAQGVNAWVFSDPNAADMFEARWLADEIGRAAGDCAQVAKHAGLLTQPGVLKFFVGKPMGSHCLGHVVATVCGTNEPPEVLIETLANGLPVGQARVQPLQDGRPQASGLEPRACIDAVFDGLDKTLAP